MAVRIRDTDTFIIERAEKNHHVTGEDIRDYVPPFEPGVKVAFFQSRAPVGWTQISGVNNTTIKIVHTDVGPGLGGRTLGSTEFTSCFTSSVAVPMPSHTHTFSQSNHNHALTGNGHGHGCNFNGGHSHSGGGGGGHTHPARLTGMGGPNKWHSDLTGGSGSGGSYSTGSGGGTFSFGASKSGVSVSNANVTGSPSAKTLSVGTSNPVDVSGTNSPTINMELKYRDCIICSKDVY